jgi:hypothetical protein
VKRAEFVILELLKEGTRDSAESAAKRIVRLGLRQDGCRLEVETAGPLPLLSGLDAEHQGRKWAELSYARRTAEAQAGEQEIARRAGVPVLAGQPESDPAEVHVVADDRAATWHVYDAGVAVRLSEHATETEAGSRRVRVRAAPRRPTGRDPRPLLPQPRGCDRGRRRLDTGMTMTTRRR